MPIVPIDGVGTLGIITDKPPHEIPPPAWSRAENMHFEQGFAERMLGHRDLFGTKSGDPHFVGYARSLAGISFFVYANDVAVFAYDTAHTVITRASGAYTVTGKKHWQGGVMNGLFYLNNSSDDPQIWSPVSSAQLLIDLPNWPADTLCKIMRSYKNHMVALDITKGGVRDRRLVKWSHPAVAGTYPSSWDETDTTKDTGEYSLGETEGQLVDCATLRDVNVLYKDDSIWGMQHIGGLPIFRFFKMFGEHGALSKNCAVEFEAGKHLVIGKDDVFVHDGNQMQSVLRQRVRANLFNSMDKDEALFSYVQIEPECAEVWICYAETGFAYPNVALVWNWLTGATGKRDIPLSPSMVRGIFDEEVAEDLWNSNAITWNFDQQAWGQTVSNPSLTRIIMADPTNTKLQGVTPDAADHDGVLFTAELERTGLGIPFDTQALPDITSMKFCRRIWPRISGTLGATMQVRFGGQAEIGGTVTWTPWQNFTIGSTKHIDIRVSARMFAIGFRSTATMAWKLHGYSLDVARVGTQ
jgi:hypothetical protein